MKIKEPIDSKNSKSTTFEELLDAEYGPHGSPEREQFERDAEAFILAERQKENCLSASKSSKD